MQAGRHLTHQVFCQDWVQAGNLDSEAFFSKGLEAVMRLYSF